MQYKDKISVSTAWIYAYFAVVFFFFLSHGLMLALYGAWWDDMLIWDPSLEAYEKFAGSDNFNNPFLYILHKSILQITSLETRNFVFRLISFFCWFVSLTCFFLFLKKITNNINYTFYSSLLAASCGLNKCMALICCFHYTISISLFMMGLVLFVEDYYKERKLYLLVVSLLWTLSLLIWRTAVLAIPVVLVVAVISRMDVKIARREFYLNFLKNLFTKYYMIIIGLCIFAVLYKTILAPHGSYAAYYSVGVKNVILSPITTMSCCFSLILGYLSNLLNVYSQSGTVTLVSGLSILLACLWFRCSDEKDVGSLDKSVLWLSCLFLFFSMMPHLLREIVYLFDINGYKSRVTALAVFPLCMIYGVILTDMKNVKVRLSVLCILVVSSVYYSINIYSDYARGWLKNEAIAGYFSSHNELKGKKIVCIDNAQIYSPFQSEHYRYYDFEGCAKLAYGNDDNTKCDGWNTFNTIYRRFDDADYYLCIDKKEQHSYRGISLIYESFNKQKRNSMSKTMLTFRQIEKDECIAK